MQRLFKCLRHSGLFNLAVKAGLTLAAFWFVFRGVDFGYLRDIVINQDHWMVFVCAFLMLCQLGIGASRWRMILSALSGAGEKVLSQVAALRIYYISVFFSCCLPGAVAGDVVRVWLCRGEDIPMPITIHSVIIDRVMALGALMLMVVATLPMLGNAVGFNTSILLPLILLAGIFGLWLLFRIDRWLAPVKHIRMVHWLLYFVSSLRLILTRPSIAIISLASALLGHIVYCAAVYVLARSLSIDITLLQCIMVMPPVLLATTLPISIGGWGVREAGTVGMLALIGIAKGPALMLSIQVGIIYMLTSLPASILWLMYRKRSNPETALGGTASPAFPDHQ